MSCGSTTCNSTSTLDEATSSLDSNTERAVMDALHNLGKAKTVGQMAAIVLLILGHERLGRMAFLVPVVMWVAVVIAFVSMVQYFVRFARQAGFD